ncbi:hypothetical protein HanXRQr2_Chr17g0798881 [Helianthus annuus]|uniref:WAT1-related protein n=1 Tax=Helianthus annuus TaxID=4232 RepID=A0A9K3DGD9_HELAN|nr:hypothetical protein HanXRQr2_Chr17g0798881 [Helianthus annuus]
MAIAISNLGPGITFLIAVFFRYKHYPLYFKIRKPNAKYSLCFRLEKLDTTISSVAKLLGTMISILGAMVFTLYQGPRMFHINSPNQLFLSQPSEWIYGSLIILVSLIFGCIWVVLQVIVCQYLFNNFHAYDKRSKSYIQCDTYVDIHVITTS